MTTYQQAINQACNEIKQGDSTDLGHSFKIMKRAKQIRHQSLKYKNTEIIEKSGIKHRFAGDETILFREDNKPKIDFYPSTGRWRIAGGKKVYRGGAKSFINWYKKLTKEE